MPSEQSKRSLLTNLLTVTIVCALAVMPEPASASPVGGYNKVDQKCRDSIAKFFGKTVYAGAKVSSTCHKSRAAGSVAAATDCNDLLQADTKLKFQKAQDKFTGAIDKLCTSTGAGDALLTEFTSCPEPCNTETGVSNPIANYTELGKCLACLAGDIAGRRSAAMVGSATLPLSKDEQKCEFAIGKGYAKRLKIALNMRAKCQSGEDASGNIRLQPCDTSDPKGKIASATTAAENIVDGSCAGVDLTALDSCANTNLADLKACLLSTDDTYDSEAFASGYKLDATICPVSLTLKTHAGTGIDPVPTATRLDAGWNGIGHGQDLVDDFRYGLELSCPNAQPPCGTCTITGYTDTAQQPGAFIRCREDPRIPCSNPLGTDPACPGLQECSFYLGPPLPLSASNTPICILVRAEADATGTVVVETGETNNNLALLAVAHTGISLTQPCPRCIGDTTPQDGQRDGTCFGGANDGLACDVQGFDTTFGNTSLDCVPATNQNISGQGLRIKPNFTTGTQSLPFGTTCDYPLNGYACACAVCSGDSTVPCNSDAECSAVGAGTCTINGGGAPRQPNACSDLICSDIGGGKGECAAGPDVHYCDGELRANGKGLIACEIKADCDAVATACQGNNCGDCTITEPRSCFLNPVIATGSADPETPIIAAAYCVPPTSSSGVNGATGLPGPSRGVVQVETIRNY